MAAPLQAAGAISNVNKAATALNTSLKANAGLDAGAAPVANMNKALAANNIAANQFAMGANKVANAANREPRRGNKSMLNSAQKHFSSAAINAAANQPIKAASHARMGVNALKNYIGANL